MDVIRDTPLDRSKLMQEDPCRVLVRLPHREHYVSYKLTGAVPHGESTIFDSQGTEPRVYDRLRAVNDILAAVSQGNGAAWFLRRSEWNIE
jgi:threonine dehydratase